MTQLGLTPFFMMGNTVAGLAQEASGVFKATDGATARANYTITATVTGTTAMNGTPTVSAATLPDSDDDTAVYFTVSVRCGSGMVAGPTSTATVQVSVTSNVTQFTGQLSFPSETLRDLDRP